MRTIGNKIIVAVTHEKPKAELIIAVKGSEVRASDGKVLAAGPDCKWVKVGDEITFSRSAGYERDLDGKQVRVMLETDVMTY